MAGYKITVTDRNGTSRTYVSTGVVALSADGSRKTFTGHRTSPGTPETTDGDVTIIEANVIDQKVEPN
jgi:hypothetical protein